MRRPRPIICTIVDLNEHGLVRTTQDTGGASKPSVKTATFTTTCTSPNSRSCSICLRSSLGVSPITISAFTSCSMNISSKSFAWLIVEQNTTVFLSPARSSHSVTTRSLMTRLFIICATSSISKSLPRRVTPSRASETPTSTT